ncbi:DUF4466 family protein [Chitinophaga barathri]|uniref:DUF4466 domain-containing protein n=1 Tax=Chitinophaga barathri TaxID=1647451 RepID=A0A3N4MWW9_9BACT|nr:DUF4466 family protein [Chitinophaga barathri]RPD39893.1 DUF4466 domain-containing protein [Chitinophaga barathri]
MTKKFFRYTTTLAAAALMFASCSDKDYAVPQPKNELQNDAIKRSIGPSLVGRAMEFAYAMALPADKGKIVSAQVEASIAGAPTTYLEHRSFFTTGGGLDSGVVIGNPSENKDNITTVTFSKDTMAATLRYYYVPAEAARGKEVSFKFTARASNGETVTYNLGPFKVANMEMKLDIPVSDAGAKYISITDMAAYNQADAPAHADKIDLVYLYRTTPASFGHALVAPAADPKYLPGITLPTGVNRNTKLMKVWQLRDQQLARDQFGVFIDDADFQQLNIGEGINYTLGLAKDYGVWVETTDGKYRAYIFVNAASNPNKTATLSIKRYTMK